jgi:hypothetical protein
MVQVLAESRPYTQKRHETVSYNQSNGTVYTLTPVGTDRMLFVQVLASTGDDVVITWTSDGACAATLPAGAMMLEPNMADGTPFVITIGTGATIEFLTLGND